MRCAFPAVDEDGDAVLAGVIAPGGDRPQGVAALDCVALPGCEHDRLAFEDLGLERAVGLHVVDGVVDHQRLRGLAGIVDVDFEIQPLAERDLAVQEA